jgi:hypothetical protein
MDEPTQAEKLAALHNDRLLKRGVAYSQVVDLYNPQPGGRFAIGAQQPLTEYPRQPAHSHWHHDPIGLEPPLGYSVDQMEPVGTPAEVEASIRQLEAATQPTPTSSGMCSAAQRPPVSGAASLIRRRC